MKVGDFVAAPLDRPPKVVCHAEEPKSRAVSGNFLAGSPEFKALRNFAIFMEPDTVQKVEHEDLN
jgi:hypothetical protein